MFKINNGIITGIGDLRDYDFTYLGHEAVGTHKENGSKTLCEYHRIAHADGTPISGEEEFKSIIENLQNQDS